MGNTARNEGRIMKAVTQMLVMDRRNSAQLRVVTVVTVRPAPSTEAVARDALRTSARTHTGRLSLPAR